MCGFQLFRLPHLSRRCFDSVAINDPALPTPSVNMWVKGRGTDSYRSKPRVMGEKFSLLHQYM